MEAVSITYNKGIVIANCDTAWSEFSGSGVTETADTADKQVGRASAKFVTVGVGANVLLGTQRVRNLDLTGAVKIKAMFKSSIALSAGDLKLLLDDTALCASPLESLDFPAALANTWTAFDVAPVTPAALTGIISVGIKQIVNLADFTLRIDDIYATLPTTSFNALWVKGMDYPESVMITGQQEKLLDSSYYSRGISYQRAIEINFGVIDSKADMVALFDWVFRAEIMQITYGGETLDVVPANAAEFILNWENAFKYSKSLAINLIEKYPRRTKPTSWSS